MACVCVCSLSVCVCQSQVGVLSKGINGLIRFLARRLLSSYSDIYKIRVVPSGIFFYTPDLENFATAYGISIVERAIN